MFQSNNGSQPITKAEDFKKYYWRQQFYISHFEIGGQDEATTLLYENSDSSVSVRSPKRDQRSLGSPAVGITGSESCQYRLGISTTATVFNNACRKPGRRFRKRLLHAPSRPLEGCPP